MEHLTGEDLARLVDEAPDAAEQIHLDVCGRCAGELQAMMEQRKQLATLCDIPAPDAIRLRLERQLAAEGLLIAPRQPGLSWTRAIAAGFVLFVLGGASGALVAERLSPEGAPAVAAATMETTSSGDAEPSTVEAAAAEMQRTEAAYLQAVSRYAALSESGEGLDPLNRLAALEGIMLTTEAALRQAPADPIINNYHLTALGQRDALIRELQLAQQAQEWF